MAQAVEIDDMKVVDAILEGVAREAGLQVQTLVFNKGKFKTANEAKLWAKAHKFDVSKVEETSDSFRIRQEEPAKFHEGTFRTIRLTDGVDAVVAKMTEGMTLQTCPWDVESMPDDPKQMWIGAWNAEWAKGDKLHDDARKIQARTAADKAVRDAGWVRVEGNWVNEKTGGVQETQWDSAYVTSLPDSSFAYVDDKGNRHLPYKDKSGKVDAAHVRNALARLNQTAISSEAKAKAKAKLVTAAKSVGVDVSEGAPGNAQDDIIAVSLKESVYDQKTGILEKVCLIEAGTNEAKRRHYPKATVEEAAANFKGLKMYVNHPTQAEEQARPERDLRDWGSTILEAWPDNGKAMAKVAIHDPWLKELLADPVARQNIGLSINCRGQFYEGTINGKPMQVVEKILVEKGEHGRKSSVDWVTEPGARGRVMESFSRRREDLDMLETVTLKDLRENRPELVESIEADVREQMKKEAKPEMEKAEVEQIVKETVGAAVAEAVKTAVPAAVLAVQESTLAAQTDKMRRREKIETLVNESTLPKPAKTKIIEQLVERPLKDDAEIKAAVEAAVAAEQTYIKSIGGVRPKTGGATGVREDGGATNEDGTRKLSPMAESIQKGLEDRFRVPDPSKLPPVGMGGVVGAAENK